MKRAQRQALSTPPSASPWPIKALLPLFFALVVAAYFPALKGAFLWDDLGHVTNPELQSWRGLLRIWLEPGVTQQYYPLLHSAFWVEHRLWGDATVGYHLVNAFWHALSACLLVVVLRRLAVPGALLAGLLFALHPVCVESVAWISEQKNTLSAVLYLAAALAWLRFEKERRPSRYAIASLLFLAALLTKSVTATLPAALLVLAWWQRGRLSWRRDVLPLLPWLVLGVTAGLFTAWFERTGIGAQGSDFDLSVIERGLLAGRIFWFYLSKLAWPLNLMFHYPRWQIDGAAVGQYLFPLVVLALVGVFIWWARSKGRRGPLAVLLLFVGTLFPALGFVNVYPFVFSYVSDHFQYLASLSVFALAAAGGVEAARHRAFGLTGGWARAIAVAVLAALGALTWNQSRQYTDNVALYRATLARNPDSWIARHNLALELAQQGELAAALAHAKRVLELKPDYPEGLNNLADYMIRSGQAAEALPLIDRALYLQPNYAQAENTWGLALMVLGCAEEGMERFRRAIALQPSLAEAHYNLGLAEADKGDFAAAAAHFAEAARLKPDHAGAEMHWGVALAISKGMADARPHFERAITIDPESPEIRRAYGHALLSVGAYAAAVQQLRTALELDPSLRDLHRHLAFALQQLGRDEEAQWHAAEARRAR